MTRKGRMEKMPHEIQPGDTIETEDGFSLSYLHVERVEVEGKHYTFYGHDGIDEGELYAVRGEPMEVLTFPLERFGASIDRLARVNPMGMRWEVYAEHAPIRFMYADTLDGAVELAREVAA